MSITMRLQPLVVCSVTALFLGVGSAIAQPDSLHVFESLAYEYFCQHAACDQALVVAIPGFTQHNRSPEFFILKSFFQANGFDYLIINPRQHGDVFSWWPVFSWGGGEVDEVLTLLDSLNVVQRHRAVHLLGFSLGGKAVLRMAADATLREQVASVVAVAAPWRVGDINIWLSGQLDKPLEGVISSAGAYDRSSLARLTHMALLGLSGGLAVNKKSPAQEISRIRAPTLLLHGRNDWLTRSSHSKRLFQEATEQQHVAFVPFRTHTHGEDMLSRHDTALRWALLETLRTWFDYVASAPLPATKAAFNEAFLDSLYARPVVAKTVSAAASITLMRTPVQYVANTRLWNSAPDLNYPIASFNSAINLNGDPSARLFVSMGASHRGPSLLNKFRAGLALEQEPFGDALAAQVYLSLLNEAIG